MTTRPVKDQAASIRARLLIHAKEHRNDYNRILTRYAIERLLFRLSKTNAAKSYVLKGAMLFVTWPEHVFRPTGDLATCSARVTQIPKPSSSYSRQSVRSTCLTTASISIPRA